jgi:hypothetical protein
MSIYLFLFLAKMFFLVLLGRLAQYFPCTLKEKASRIIYQILYELEKEVKSNNAQINVY